MIESLRLEYENTIQQHPDADAVMERVGCSLCTLIINLKCGLLLLMPEYLACQCVCI